MMIQHSRTARRRYGHALVGLSMGLLALLLAGPATAEGGLVEGIVKMLEAELAEEVILEWLPTASVPTELTAEDLVALKQAGASPDLLRELIRLVRAAGPSGLPPAPAQPASEPAATGQPEATAPEAAATAPMPSDETSAPVAFVLSYLPRVEEPDPEWDLYVYIDGIPVSYVPSASMMNRPTEIEFSRAIPAGTHTLRVTQERHFRKGGHWKHLTRAADDGFVFELSPGEPAQITVEFRQRMMDLSNPLSFKMSQGTRNLDSARVGGDAEFWPLLCEDVEASMEKGSPTRSHQRQLEGCVRWSEWWGLSKVPSRTEVLDAMSKFGFRPVPKGS